MSQVKLFEDVIDLVNRSDILRRTFGSGLHSFIRGLGVVLKDRAIDKTSLEYILNYSSELGKLFKADREAYSERKWMAVGIIAGLSTDIRKLVEEAYYGNVSRKNFEVLLNYGFSKPKVLEVLLRNRELVDYLLGKPDGGLKLSAGSAEYILKAIEKDPVLFEKLYKNLKKDDFNHPEGLVVLARTVNYISRNKDQLAQKIEELEQAGLNRNAMKTIFSEALEAMKKDEGKSLKDKVLNFAEKVRSFVDEFLASIPGSNRAISITTRTKLKM